jgi:hypothetical protein
VVQIINTASRNDNEFGVIIELCRSLLNLIKNSKLSYIRRQVNRVTHDLAQTIRLMLVFRSLIIVNLYRNYYYE